jgi:prevent-host-death family protein
MDSERTVSLAEAKAHLSELMARVEAGERFHVTKRGKRIATVSPADTPRQPVDIAWLRSVTAKMRHHDVSAGDLLREERDRARY